VSNLVRYNGDLSTSRPLSPSASLEERARRGIYLLATQQCGDGERRRRSTYAPHETETLAMFLVNSTSSRRRLLSARIFCNCASDILLCGYYTQAAVSVERESVCVCVTKKLRRGRLSELVCERERGRETRETGTTPEAEGKSPA